jgi:hypothetical protein
MNPVVMNADDYRNIVDREWDGLVATSEEPFRSLVERAAREPRLRALFPVRSLNNLRLSSNTEYPYQWHLPYLSLLPDGTYLARDRTSEPRPSSDLNAVVRHVADCLDGALRMASMTPGLHEVSQSDASALIAVLRRDSYGVFEMSSTIHGRLGFFAAVREVLPLDPPVTSDDNWDALSDSLWEGLSMEPLGKIAIVWPEPSLMQQMSPADFAIACDVLRDVAELLGDEDATVGAPKAVVVLLVTVAVTGTKSCQI